MSTLGLRFFGHLAVEGIQKRQKIVAFLCTLSSRDSPGSSCENLRAARDLPQGSLWNMALDDGHIRQAQFYVFSENKRGDKIRYMHRNPVKGIRAAAATMAQQLSALRRRRRGVVLVNNEEREAELKVRKVAYPPSFTVSSPANHHKRGCPILAFLQGWELGTPTDWVLQTESRKDWSGREDLNLRPPGPEPDSNGY